MNSGGDDIIISLLFVLPAVFVIIFTFFGVKRSLNKTNKIVNDLKFFSLERNGKFEKISKEKFKISFNQKKYHIVINYYINAYARFDVKFNNNLIKNNVPSYIQDKLDEKMNLDPKIMIDKNLVSITLNSVRKIDINNDFNFILDTLSMFS